ncbi:hypothetical protein EVAR_47313_1 [Eumeta japonica]|uniref:Uncharacterized protein n=1 Tax=Eumeta variegata TaxID=151549 RepID=A0A4C1YGJ1_EUMVA|nr:hypothetical protein EVAR_47313_1 [Eumeta japonica]
MQRYLFRGFGCPWAAVTTYLWWLTGSFAPQKFCQKNFQCRPRTCKFESNATTDPPPPLRPLISHNLSCHKRIVSDLYGEKIFCYFC